MDSALEARLYRLLQEAPVDADEATREAWLAQLSAEERQLLEDLAAAWIADQLAAWLPPGALHDHDHDHAHHGHHPPADPGALHFHLSLGGEKGG